MYIVYARDSIKKGTISASLSLSISLFPPIYWGNMYEVRSALALTKSYAKTCMHVDRVFAARARDESFCMETSAKMNRELIYYGCCSF